MKKIEAHYWILQNGVPRLRAQRLICEIDLEKNVWEQVLTQVRHDVSIRGEYTMNNVLNIQMGDVVK